MTQEEIIQYSSFGIGIFGIAVALIQGFERKKLKQFMHSQAWQIFSFSNLSHGSAQAALKLYKQDNGEKPNTEILEYLSKCDAYNVSLFIESIRQIQLSEPEFNIETITSWQMQGRISKQQFEYFLKIMPMKTPSIIYLAWSAATLKIRKKLVKSISPDQNKTNSGNNDDPIQ